MPFPGLPLTMAPGAAIGGDGSYAYQWQTRTTYGLWENASGGATSAAYAISVSNVPSQVVYYRRVVSSCGVMYYSNEAKVSTFATPKQTVLATQNLCPNAANSTLNMAAATSGTGAYTYKWQVSDNGSTGWADQANGNPNTNPTLSFTTPSTNKYFRRIVTSGCYNDTSTSTLVNVTLTVAAGSITAPSACATGATGNVTFASASAATVTVGTLAYEWRSSTVSDFSTGVTNSVGNSTTLSVAASSTLFYRRYVTACGVVATAFTPSAQIGRSGAAVQNTLTDGAACPGQSVTVTLANATIPNGTGTITYAWQYSSGSGATGAWTDMPAINTWIVTGVDSMYLTAKSDNSITFTMPRGRFSYQLFQGANTPYIRRKLDVCGSATTPAGIRYSASSINMSQGVDGDVATCPSTPITLSPTHTPTAGVAYTYQWQRSDDGLSYISIAGATSPTLSITSSSTPNKHELYRRLLRACNGLLTNEPGRTQIITNGNALAQPLPAITDIKGCPSDSSTLLIGTATGGVGGYTYQWQQSTDLYTWTSVPNANELNVRVKNPDKKRFVYYRRAVSSCSGGITIYSVPIKVTGVEVAIDLGGIQSLFEVAAGSVVNLWPEISTSGGELGHQWLSSRDNVVWTEIAGADKVNYQVTAPSGEGEFSLYYKRRSINSCSQEVVHSSPTRLYVPLGGCPYTGSDLVAGSCRKRGKWDAYGGVDQGDASKVGVENWEAKIMDARDGKTYRIVQMGKDWWMAQNLNYQRGLTDAGSSNQPTTASSLKGYYWCSGYKGSKETDGQSACDTYGALYSGETMMSADGIGAQRNATNAVPSGVRGVCPEGWHAPSQTEWNRMLDCAEGDCDAQIHTNCPTNATTCGSIAAQTLKSVQVGDATTNTPLWRYYNDNVIGTDRFGFSVLPASLRESNGSSFRDRGEKAYFWTTSDITPASNSGIYRVFHYSYTAAYQAEAPYAYGWSVRCIADLSYGKPDSSTAPTSIVASHEYVANGQASLLTATGGVMGTNGAFQWGTGSTPGSNIIVGASTDTLTVYPNAVTTYWVRRVDNGVRATSAAFATIAVNVCPYKGSDLVANTCMQRPDGARNWVAQIRDSRDGELYSIVQTGSYWFFAQDLRHNIFPDNHTYVTATNARLYNANTLRENFSSFCPAGWLPQDETYYKGLNTWLISNSLRTTDAQYRAVSSALVSTTVTQFAGTDINGGYYSIIGQQSTGYPSGTTGYVLMQGSPMGLQITTGLWSYKYSSWFTGNERTWLRCYRGEGDMGDSIIVSVPERVAVGQPLTVSCNKNATWAATGGGSIANNSSLATTITWSTAGSYNVTATVAGVPYQRSVTVESCPYTESDLVAGSCAMRTTGAKNWTARIWSGGAGVGRANDRAQYPIVQLDNTWWFATELEFVPASGSVTIPQKNLRLYNQTAASTGNICPTGWQLPSAHHVNPLTADVRNYIAKDSLIRSACSVTFTGNGYTGLNLREVGWMYNTVNPSLTGATYAMANASSWGVVSWSPCRYNAISNGGWTDANHLAVRCVRQFASTAPTGIDATNTYVASGRTTTLTATGATLGSNFVSYQWSNNASFTSILSNTQSYTPAPAATTTYFVRVLDAAGRATGAASITITVGACPYTGADLVAGSCIQRATGAQNWQATIADARIPGAGAMGTGAAGTPGSSRRTYRIVQMPAGPGGANLWWLAQNLAYVPAAADNTVWMYANDDIANFAIHGIAYRQTDEYLCPAGWRAPYYNEFKAMLECVEGNCAGDVFSNGHSVNYGSNIRARLGATTPVAIGNDDYGFSWLYSGIINGGIWTPSAFGTEGPMQIAPPANVDLWWTIYGGTTGITSHNCCAGRYSRLVRRCVMDR